MSRENVIQQIFELYPKLPNVSPQGVNFLTSMSDKDLVSYRDNLNQQYVTNQFSSLNVSGNTTSPFGNLPTSSPFGNLPTSSPFGNLPTSSSVFTGITLPVSNPSPKKAPALNIPGQTGNLSRNKGGIYETNPTEWNKFAPGVWANAALSLGGAKVVNPEALHNKHNIGANSSLVILNPPVVSVVNPGPFSDVGSFNFGNFNPPPFTVTPPNPIPSLPFNPIPPNPIPSNPSNPIRQPNPILIPSNPTPPVISVPSMVNPTQGINFSAFGIPKLANQTSPFGQSSSPVIILTSSPVVTPNNPTPSPFGNATSNPFGGVTSSPFGNATASPFGGAASPFGNSVPASPFASIVIGNGTFPSAGNKGNQYPQTPSMGGPSSGQEIQLYPNSSQGYSQAYANSRIVPPILDKNLILNMKVPEQSTVLPSVPLPSAASQMTSQGTLPREVIQSPLTNEVKNVYGISPSVTISNIQAAADKYRDANSKGLLRPMTAKDLRIIADEFGIDPKFTKVQILSEIERLIRENPPSGVPIQSFQGLVQSPFQGFSQASGQSQSQSGSPILLIGTPTASPFGTATSPVIYQTSPTIATSPFVGQSNSRSFGTLPFSSQPAPAPQASSFSQVFTPSYFQQQSGVFPQQSVFNQSSLFR